MPDRVTKERFIWFVALKVPVHYSQASGEGRQLATWQEQLVEQNGSPTILVEEHAPTTYLPNNPKTSTRVHL